MINDEYNKVEITNDKQLRRVEFGKTQKAEFSSKKENTIPEGELNEKYVGKTIKKVTEVNVEYIKKIPTHTTTTVIQSAATTASSAAAAAVSTVAAASTVAVVAVATVAGVSVALHNYHCELTSLLISSNEISYKMTIANLNEDYGITYQSYYDNVVEPRYSPRKAADTSDEPIHDDIHEEEEPTTEESSVEDSIFNSSRPFVLTVSNDEYSASHYLKYGNSERETFSGLTLGSTYDITLKENRIGGAVIYSESFTTQENSYIKEFYMSGEANFRKEYFDVYLDFVDELEVLSDLTLTLTDQEDNSNVYNFPLETTYGYQSVQTANNATSGGSFDFLKTYDYSLTYKKSGDVIEFDSGVISFYNVAFETSEVYGVTWDKKANFLTNTTEITLSFQDDYDLFSDFKFVLIQQEPITADTQDPLVYSLRKTTSPQTITLTDYQQFNYSYTYTYMFTYMQEGTEIEQIIDSGEDLQFEDNSGAESVINEVVWDKTANFLTREFTVQLDFVDDFDYYSDFSLTLSDHEYPEEVSEVFSLYKTTDPQTIAINEDSSINFRREYDYSFSCLNYGVRETFESGTVKFVDNSNGRKEFTSFVIDPVPNFDDRTFDVELNYVDDYDELSSFILEMYTNADDTTTYILDATTEVQTLSADYGNYPIDFLKTYTYNLSYWDSEVEDYVVAVSEETITFDTTNAVSQFNDFIFYEEGNYQDESFVLRLDFVDQLHHFTDFLFTLWVFNTDWEMNIHMSATIAPQTFYLDSDETSSNYKPNMVYDTFVYSFKYYDTTIDDYVSVVESQEFQFDNSNRSVFSGIETNFDFTQETGSTTYLLPVRFLFDNTPGTFTSFSLDILKDGERICDVRFEGETLTDEWLYATIILLNNATINDIVGASGIRIRVTAGVDLEEYPNSDPTIVVYHSPEDEEFTLGSRKEILGGYIRSNYINAYNTDIATQFYYSGQSSDFECTFVVQTYDDQEFESNFTLNGANYNYITLADQSMDEETFNDLFIDHPVKVSVKYRTRGIGRAATDPSETWSDYFTMVLYDSFYFELSV